MRVRKNKEAGFSLLEVAIVILILGLIAVPLIQSFRIYQQARSSEKTDLAVSNSAAALAEYFSINGQYPCPSDPTLPRNDDMNGVEDCAGAAGAGWPASFANGFDFDGVGGPDNLDGLAGPDRIYRGALPFRTLGIPFEDSVDGYGSKLTYVVSRSQTEWYNSQVGAIPGVDRSGWGVIQVRLEDEENTGAFAMAVDIDSDGPDADLYPDNGLLDAIVFSHGPDQRGAFPIWGAPNANPCAAANGIDFENCNNDAFFEMRKPREAAGAQYFDDVVAARLWTYQGAWMQNGLLGSISPTAPGMIGIGIGQPTERLHVAGNVRANNFRTDLICDDNGSCIQPQFIGGTGDDCGTGRVLVGYHRGRVRCVAPAIIPGSLANQQCGLDGTGAQMFVAGVNPDGTLNCVVR